MGEILFDKLKIVEKAKKTKTGQYVTSEEVLQQLKNKHEIVADILEHRGLKKLIGTYIDALPKLINPRTGHIHTSFNQTITATGRLSSSDPNLQLLVAYHRLILIYRIFLFVARTARRFARPSFQSPVACSSLQTIAR